MANGKTPPEDVTESGWDPTNKPVDFQDQMHWRWRASGMSLEDFMKSPQSGNLIAKGYVYDKDAGRFSHPDEAIRNVDPNSIPSEADRNFARASQGFAKAAQGGRPTPPGATYQTNPQRQQTPPAQPAAPPSAIQARITGVPYRNYGSGKTGDEEWNRDFKPSTTVRVNTFDPVRDIRAGQQAAEYQYGTPEPGSPRSFNRPIDIERYTEPTVITPGPWRTTGPNPALPPSARPHGYVEPPVSKSWLKLRADRDWLAKNLPREYNRYIAGSRVY